MNSWFLDDHLDKEIIGLYEAHKDFYENPLREGTPG